MDLRDLFGAPGAILGTVVVTFAAACSSSPQGTGGSMSSSAGGGAAAGGAASSSSSSSSSSASSSSGSSGQSSSSSSSSSSASSSSGSPSADPCGLVADGDHCGSDLGGTADHGSVYYCAAGHTTGTTPCPYGCSGGACATPPSDPCSSAQYGNGAYCGGTLSGGDASALYDCQNEITIGKTACPSGCQVNPPGVADACKSAGEPCSGASSGDGAYCGSGLPGGDANVLYDCQGGHAASQTTCAAGCQVNPPGTPDACKPTGGAICCLEHPPGVLTQSYSACGLGGSHYGIDYGTPVGTPIYAGISGTVVGSALGYPNCYSNGCTSACWNAFNYVKIKSDCGDPDAAGHDLFVYYLHIDGLGPGIGNGTHVDQGQLVAISGNSGCSSGPHIHLETVSVPTGGGATLSTCASVDPASRYCP